MKIFLFLRFLRRDVVYRNMIRPKMLSRSALAPDSNSGIHRSWPGRDLVPVVRFRTDRAARMSVSRGSPSHAQDSTKRISTSVASYERSFPSPVLVERRGGEWGAPLSVSEETPRFGKYLRRIELKDELVMEEDEREAFEVEPDVLVGGGDGDGGENWFNDGYGDSGPGSGSMDEFYQKMIKAYPDDALILINYARFLKEVKGDVVKAEEYCQRAILAKPSDGNALSLYGDLIWQTHRDSDRAQTYFDQAVHSSPHDCYVLASYAKFLWDAGDEDESEEDEIENTITNTQHPISEF